MSEEPYSSELLPSREERSRSTLLNVCPFILGNEFCERLAFYGLSTNLVIYLTRIMGQDSGFAAVQLNLFEGTCYLTPLLGAWLADSLWGRYRTILVFSTIYFLGMVMLALTAWIPSLTPSPDEYPTALQNTALYTSLYVVALGTGGIKPNVSAFGADQFDESNPRDRREKTSFFNWFYFSINLGSLLAVTVIVWVQENISWAVGFAIPALCMALAIVVFVAGSSEYKHVAPSESPFSRVFKVTWAAFRARRRSIAASDAMSNGNGALGDGANGRHRSVSFAFSPVSNNRDMESEISFREPFLDGALDAEASGSIIHHSSSIAWLDAAVDARHPGGARRFTRQQVEEVKLVLRMLPVFFATILYWTIYMQMGSFFVVQGARMDRRIELPWFTRDDGSSVSFYIPAASLSVINTVAIVALIPMYDKILVPVLRKAGRPMTLLRRIGWGLAVCVVAMCVAAAVESYRLKLFKEGKLIGDERDGVVDISVWWQIPQYLLIGLSEVFTSIGQMEFFYDQAPDVMRSCSMALQLLSVCVGSYLSGALVWVTQAVTASLDPDGEGWLPKDLNYGRLDMFFAFLGALMVVNLLHFMWVAARYEYKVVEHVKRVVPPTRPPRRQQRKPPTAPVPSAAVSAAHAVRVAVTERADAESPMPQVYGRSVTFLPQTPALPAPFR